MKFGLIYELRVFPPVTEAQAFDNVLEQIAFAEEMGFDYVWMVEHHFTATESHSSAPEVFFGALSQRTKKIRIGFGVTLLPTAFNHPIRVAERVAALDILSHGRAELGTGRSNPYEQLGFGIEPADSRPMWEESISLIPRMWTEDVFTGHDGQYFKIPPRMIVPKPVQKPHPPMWMAMAQPASFDVAASKGLGVLCNSIGVPQRLARRVRMYKDAVKSPSAPVSAFINDQVSAFVMGLAGEDDRQTRTIVGNAYKNHYAPRKALTKGAGTPTSASYDQTLTNFYTDYAKQLDELGRPFPDFLKYNLEKEQGAHLQTKEVAQLDGDQLVADGVLMAGDPESCIRVAKMYEEAGVDQVMLAPDFGGITHEQIMESYRLFGEYVIPKFRKVPAISVSA